MTTSDCAPVEQALNIKRFKRVRVSIYKHGWRMSEIRARKRVFGWRRSWFKLCYWKNGVYLPIGWNFQFIRQSSYLTLNLKRADILLSEFLCNSKGCRYGIPLVKTQHGPLALFHKYRLVLPVIMGRLVGHRKRNGISCLNPGGSNSRKRQCWAQIQRAARGKAVSNLIRSLACCWQRGIIYYRLNSRQGGWPNRRIIKAMDKET